MTSIFQRGMSLILGDLAFVTTFNIDEGLGSSQAVVDQYKRRRGKALSSDERRSVHHCYEICKQEKYNGRVVLTSNPLARTAHYLGIALNAVTNVITRESSVDKRGRHARYVLIETYISDIRRCVTELNAQGKTVTTQVLYNQLCIWYNVVEENERNVAAAAAMITHRNTPEREALTQRNKQVLEINDEVGRDEQGTDMVGEEEEEGPMAPKPRALQVPSRETIRLLRHKMGFVYKDVGVTKNFVDTEDIKKKRKRYLQGLHAACDRNALVVYIDETFCNQNHVANKSWFMPGMLVVRKNKGKRYCILHAGCTFGWIGEPKVWPAKYEGTSDYHENMNSAIFERYLSDFCTQCRTEGHEDVVFVMDNAKYHRRESSPEDDLEEQAPIHGLEEAGVVNGVDEVYADTEEASDPDWEDIVQAEELKRKTLSQLSKPELIGRLKRFGQDEEQLKQLKKPALYAMAQEERFRIPLKTEKIIERFGHKTLWLPPCHPDLYPIEQAWGLTKNYVAKVNDGTDLDGFIRYDEKWFGLVNHSNTVADNYIRQDRINVLPYERMADDIIYLDESEDEDTDESDNDS
ncbi:hypothetical protein EMPS_00119 [Entomortierella parvispora]|uniref:Tc1-like transposase DDE domain-containing protein n=1 Tax=Entomortierella parvispora TaxID=205924 RepID=A0A9P3GZ86_9FUNG|nr:hypothetical protein EMPS_00119 [Entomortierella parvispora]